MATNGRPSKLTEKQWAEIERRALAGERLRDMAKEFGVVEGTLRNKLSARVKNIKAVANQLASAEVAYESLAVDLRVKTRSLADKLKLISENLADTAVSGTLTAKYLAHLANGEVQKIDETDISGRDSQQAMRNTAQLTALSNESAKTGLNLLAANKEKVQEQQERRVVIVGGLPDER